MAPPWIPEMARSEPRTTLGARYRAVVAGRPAGVPPGWQCAVEDALHAAGVRWRQAGPRAWEVYLPWTTLVLGLVRRKVEERLVLRLTASPEGATLEVEGIPAATHAAHATGFAGVLVVAATAWVATGWVTGIPAAVTTALAGGLWADATREMAFTALQRRVGRLLEDIGRAVWPGAPAEPV